MLFWCRWMTWLCGYLHFLLKFLKILMVHALIHLIFSEKCPMRLYENATWARSHTSSHWKTQIPWKLTGGYWVCIKLQTIPFNASLNKQTTQFCISNGTDNDVQSMHTQREILSTDIKLSWNSILLKNQSQKIVRCFSSVCSEYNCIYVCIMHQLKWGCLNMQDFSIPLCAYRCL